jgi:hypothetical protein
MKFDAPVQLAATLYRVRQALAQMLLYVLHIRKWSVANELKELEEASSDIWKQPITGTIERVMLVRRWSYQSLSPMQAHHLLTSAEFRGYVDVKLLLRSINLQDLSISCLYVYDHPC